MTSMVARLSPAAGARSLWECKPVTGVGREARMEIVRNFFQGLSVGEVPSDTLQQVESGALKCRLLYENTVPKAIFVHSRDTRRSIKDFSACLEVNTFCLIDRSKNDAVFNAIFSHLVDSIKEEQGRSISFSLLKSSTLIFSFLASKSFKVISEDATKVVMAHLLEQPAKRKREENGEEPGHSRGMPESGTAAKRPREDSRPVPHDTRIHPSQKPEQPLGITLKKVYIEQIRRGVKTVEGRINSGMFKNIKEGRLVRFFYLSNQADDVVCRVTKIAAYKSFKEMLEKEGFKKCVNEAASLERAVQIYDGIPNYKEKAAIHGVLGFHLQLHPKS